MVTIFLNGALLSKLARYYMPWYMPGGAPRHGRGRAHIHGGPGDADITGRIYGYTVLVGAEVGTWLQAAILGGAGRRLARERGQLRGLHHARPVHRHHTLALTIANTVFLNGSSAAIARALLGVPLSDIRAAILGASGDFVKSLDLDRQIAVLKAVFSAIDKTYVLVIAAGALVAVLSFFIKRERLFTCGDIGAV